MHKKWKSVAALSMAALLGCLMPMGTILAAEEDAETAQEIEADSVSDTDEVYGSEANVDENENTGDVVNTDGEENADNEANVDDENAVEEVIADDETVNDANEGIEVMSETDAPEAADTEAQADLPAPVISITLSGQGCKVDELGGKIDYIYVNNPNQQFEYSASQGDQELKIYYYLDKFDDITDNAKDKEQMADLWPTGLSSPMIYKLSLDKVYVLYVKAVGSDGQTTYARSCGIVVDTTAPKIVGLDEGKAYQEGTTFKVEETNLESVKVNETIVTPDSDGNYQVSANGTSCVIRVKDKAGNEKTCSITVTARTLEENGVISVNGTYSLKAGTSYQLAEGKWQVSGDSTVYQGGGTFYVKTDGDYRFTKR